MQKVSKSYLELIKVNILMEEYLRNNPKNKLSESFLKFGKQLQVIFEDYNDKVDTLQIINCAVDPVTKVVLKDEAGKKQFTIEGTIKLKEESKILLNTLVEVTPIIADDIEDLIKDLTEDQKVAFSGIVIPQI